MTPAPWAQTADASRGRRWPEPEHPYRGPYARDRDRIVHCRAFRRLEYKTQVFVNHEGDHFRTRLTHSIEVAQIARTVARALRLDEDLAESLALSHDLGHTPFGHLGEEVLGPRMARYGGFDHNRQTLRIVEVLEERYPRFPGLNLTWEVREGIAKHSGPPDPERFPEAAPYEPDVPPPLESQAIDLVDEIAYNHHDLDDGIESRLLDVAELADSVPLFGDAYRQARAAYPDRDETMWVKITLRRIVDTLVSDLVASTRAAIERHRFASVEDVRAAGTWVVALTEETAERNARLKAFLRQRLYRHPRIRRVKEHYRKVLEQLFDAYIAAPDAMPARYRAIAERDGLERAVADYIAGMTDRYALDEHHRLCGGPGRGDLPQATG